MTNTAQAFYTSWKDQGDNIGIQCSICTRTHWTGQEPATDPQTNQPCENCQRIKDLKIRENEQEIHNSHPEDDTCTHVPSQPRQLGVNYDNE